MRAMRILIIEDDAAIADAICAALTQAGHAVDRLASGRQADAALRDHPYDLVVLDLGLPDVDGIELLRRLRARADAVPVLVATAREELEERVRALDLGADDYLVKPFALREFEARARALLRRRTTQGVPELQLGRMRLDLPRRRAQVDGAPLELTPREFGLLEALASRLDRVMSREQLIEALCSWDTTLTDNGLDIAVYRLRRKLDGSGVRIRSVRGLGYLLEATDAAA
jgi:two-component system OmpR family response regulator